MNLETILACQEEDIHLALMKHLGPYSVAEASKRARIEEYEYHKVLYVDDIEVLKYSYPILTEEGLAYIAEEL